MGTFSKPGPRPHFNSESVRHPLYKKHSLQIRLEFVFQEQSYSTLYSEWSSAWDHFRGNIDVPLGIITDFCGVLGNPYGIIAYPCGIVTIPEAIGSRVVGDANRETP